MIRTRLRRLTVLVGGAVTTAALVAVSAGLSAAQSSRVRSDQDTLMELERDWDDAFHHADVKFIETVLADEFVATYPDGSRGDRKKELANAAAFDQQIDSSTLDNFIIRIYGDTAVVHFTQHMVGPVQGKPVEMAFQYVDIFVFRDGRWQCVSTQSTKISTN
jgi:ketosteroid isomerase-like protein